MKNRGKKGYDSKVLLHYSKWTRGYGDSTLWKKVIPNGHPEIWKSCKDSSSEKHADCATPNGQCLVKDPENMKKTNKKGETRGATSDIVN